ncbi:MAG: pyridine nucleotide-disulfide oxidoreductase [Acidobacteria bacterium]|nr:MAG: pyridine nucleotide-disulfide oxidoreductase [Acidobacteriota bacterium]
MPERVTVTVNGARVDVACGSTVAVAMILAGQPCRASVNGESRGPLCAMGICFECCVAINGVPHRRSCQVFCENGMEVRTDG